MTTILWWLKSFDGYFLLTNFFIMTICLWQLLSFDCSLFVFVTHFLWWIFPSYSCLRTITLFLFRHFIILPMCYIEYCVLTFFISSLSCADPVVREHYIVIGLSCICLLSHRLLMYRLFLRNQNHIIPGLPRLTWVPRKFSAK